MIDELMGAYGGRLVIAVLGVAIGLVCLIGILWLMRGRGGPSPFVRGGRNRNPRLQVLDAAAVDTRRRLVLVRRDDVEHLIMIGGPTDIVIESGIRPGSAVRSAAEAPALPNASAAPAPELPRQPQARLASAVSEPRMPVRDQAPPEPVARPAPARMAPAPAPIATGGEARFEPPRVSATLSPPPVAQTVVVPSRPEPAPVVPTRPPEEPGPGVDEAATALDAARNRVLQERPEPPRIMPISIAASAGPAVQLNPAVQPNADKPKTLGSEFDQILEEEMANNLADRDAVVIPAAPQPQQRDLRPPITGATAEPSLQDEVARIFGELSVTRDNK